MLECVRSADHRILYRVFAPTSPPSRTCSSQLRGSARRRALTARNSCTATTPPFSRRWKEAGDSQSPSIKSMQPSRALLEIPNCWSAGGFESIVSSRVWVEAPERSCRSGRLSACFSVLAAHFFIFLLVMRTGKRQGPACVPLNPDASSASLFSVYIPPSKRA